MKYLYIILYYLISYSILICIHLERSHFESRTKSRSMVSAGSSFLRSRSARIEAHSGPRSCIHTHTACVEYICHIVNIQYI